MNYKSPSDSSKINGTDAQPSDCSDAKNMNISVSNQSSNHCSSTLIEKCYPKKFGVATLGSLLVDDMNNQVSVINNDSTVNLIDPQQGESIFNNETAKVAEINESQMYSLVEFGGDVCEGTSSNENQLQLVSTHKEPLDLSHTEMKLDYGKSSKEMLIPFPRPIYSNSMETVGVNITSSENISHLPLIPAASKTLESRSHASFSGTFTAVSQSAFLREIKYATVSSKGMSAACIQLQNTFCDSNAFVRLTVECMSISNLSHANSTQPLLLEAPLVHSEKIELTFLPMREPFPTSIDTLIDQCGKLPDAINYSLLHNVALGLEFLHSLPQPVVHRDLTARNIVISTSLQAQLADFDVVTPANQLSLNSRRESSECTCDTQNDVFSFGVLVIEMFIGQAKLKGQAAVSEWVQSREYLEDIGYFHPLLSRLISQCIDGILPGRVQAADIVCQVNDIAQWFPISSSHKQQWMAILQVAAESVLLESNNYNSSNIISPLLDSIYEEQSLNMGVEHVSSEIIHPIPYALKASEKSDCSTTLNISSSDRSYNFPNNLQLQLLHMSITIPPHHMTGPYSHLNIIQMSADYSQTETIVIREVYQLSLAVDIVHDVGHCKHVSGYVNLPTSTSNVANACVHSLTYIVTTQGYHYASALNLQPAQFVKKTSPQASCMEEMHQCSIIPSLAALSKPQWKAPLHSQECIPRRHRSKRSSTFVYRKGNRMVIKTTSVCRRALSPDVRRHCGKAKYHPNYHLKECTTIRRSESHAPHTKSVRMTISASADQLTPTIRSIAGFSSFENLHTLVRNVFHQLNHLPYLDNHDEKESQYSSAYRKDLLTDSVVATRKRGFQTNIDTLHMTIFYNSYKSVLCFNIHSNSTISSSAPVCSNYSYELNQLQSEISWLLWQLLEIYFNDGPHTQYPSDKLHLFIQLCPRSDLFIYYRPNSISYKSPVLSFIVEAEDCTDNNDTDQQGENRDRDDRGNDSDDRRDGGGEENSERRGGDNHSNERDQNYSGEDGDNSESDSSDEGGDGCSGSEEDSDDKGNVNKCRHRRRKKLHLSKLQLQRCRCTHRPNSLLRGQDKLPQKDTNSTPRSSSMLLVARASAYTHFCGQTRLVEQHCNEQVYRLLINRQSVLSLLLLHHQTLLHRAQRGGANVLAVNVNSVPMQFNSHFPIEEMFHQHVSATVHGNVLIRPQVYNSSLIFSSALVDEIIQNLVMSSTPPSLSLMSYSPRPDIGSTTAHPRLPLVPSCTPDSGLGISPQILTIHGPPQCLPPNEHHPQGTLATIIPTQRRRPGAQSSSSSEPNWSLAEINLNANADSTLDVILLGSVQNIQDIHDVSSQPHPHSEPQTVPEEESSVSDCVSEFYEIETAHTEEGECLPTPTSLIVMPSTTWPWQHETSYGIQSQESAVFLEHDNGSHGGVPACETNCLPPLPCVIGSSIPLANSLNGFLALAESTNEDIVPSCVVIGPRPIPVSCTPQENVHLHPQPLPLAALPTNPHLLEGPVMFGTLMESEAPLVGIDTVPGPMANYSANSVASLASSHHHSPAVLTTSAHQPGANVLALHGTVEAMQPRELCGSL